MKKIIIIFILLLIPYWAFSDSVSLNTEITTVSMGPHNFGFGLAPTGTNFKFYKSFKMIPSLTHNADFTTRLIFSSTNNKDYRDFNYKTGTPNWINKYTDIRFNPDYYLNGVYFAPEANVLVSLGQGFGINPMAGSGSLFNIGLTYEAYYSVALEALDVKRGNWDPVFYDPVKNKYKEPFGPDSIIPAYPWLQDNRSTLVNSLTLSASINLLKPRGFAVSDGIYFSTSIELAPKWFGNTLSMKYPTADYFKFFAGLTENLTLYSDYQDNGMNWLSIMLTHYNSYSYIGGSVIPVSRLSGDRLNQSFSDSIELKIYGPQFIAYDCYTDITLNLYNSCSFGFVLNEQSRTTYVTEWSSSLGVRFHMNLFGFMHFSYSLGYSLYSGIHTSMPGFWRETKVNFYISL